MLILRRQKHYGGQVVDCLEFENGELVINDGQNVIRVEDPVFLAIQFDFRPAVLVDEHTITLFYFEKDFLSIVVHFARAYRHDEAFHRFLLGGVGNDDPALLPFLHFLFHRFHKNAVAYWSNLKCHSIHLLRFSNCLYVAAPLRARRKLIGRAVLGAPSRGLPSAPNMTQ